MNKKNTLITLIVIAVLLVAVLLLIFVPGNNTGNVVQGKTIKIGVILPLSGDYAPYGESMKNGAILALEQSGMKDNVQLIFEDDKGCDTTETMTIVQKLINVDSVNGFVGPMCSSPVLTIAPIIEQNKNLLISPSATSPLVSNSGEYIFRVMASDSAQVEALSKYLSDAGYMKAAVFYDQTTDALVQEKNIVVENFPKFGGKIVSEEAFSSKDKDFRTQIIKIKENKPDVVFISSFPIEGIEIIKQAKELGLDVQFVFTDISSKDMYKDSQDKSLFEGIVFPVQETSKSIESLKYIQDYKNRFSSEPGSFSAETYDCTALAIKAILKSKNRETAKDTLYNIGQNYQGVSGTITFDKNGDVIKPTVINKVVNGQIVILETVLS